MLSARSIRRNPGERKHKFLAIAFGISIILLVVGSFTNKAAIWRDGLKTSKFIRIKDGDWPYDVTKKNTSPVAVMAASGGGSRAAIYTALTLQKLHAEFPHIASKLQVISSVSGGSLANAAYVARRYRDFQEIRGSKDLDRLARDVHQDFLWPALMGALLPLRNRGSSIEKEWRDGSVDLGEISISQLSEGWIEAKKKPLMDPPYPLPLFNSCSLDGHDVVISALPKESYLWGDIYQESPPWPNSSQKSDDSPWTWVYYRDAIYGLEDILPMFDPQLAPAVRASANFPFGFPLVMVETNAPLRFNPVAEKRAQGRKIVKLTDGGVLSNSGIWPLFNLLMKKAGILKDRGVLLIVVEASKMPEYRDNRRSFTSLYGTIGDRNPLGQALHRRIYDLLAREYGSRMAVVQIDITPKQEFNVFTTWALDKRSYKRLHKAFEECWNREKLDIDKKWQSIQQSESQDPLYIPGTLRPPLS
jgi:predicted acylesterase/phospholipase RssA